MFKSKVFIMIVAILIAITLILTAAFVLWNYMDSASSPSEQAQNSAKAASTGKRLSPDEVQANTVQMENITTNLATADGASSRFIRVSFAFELENTKAKEEFEKLSSQMKAIVIVTLADLTADQVTGSKGFDNLTSTLMNKMNKELHEGKLNRIMITDFVIQ